MSRVCLLDTGVLLGFFLNQSWAINAHTRLGLGKPSTLVSTSHICLGEIYKIAKRRNWQKARLRNLDEFLKEVPSIGISNLEVAGVYGDLANWTEGGKNSTFVSNPPPTPARRMEHNDLWVASVAYCAKATLVFSDKDFLHLDGTWIDFEYVAPN